MTGSLQLCGAPAPWAAFGARAALLRPDRPSLVFVGAQTDPARGVAEFSQACAGAFADFAATLAAPQRDAGGELRASGVILGLVDRRAEALVSRLAPVLAETACCLAPRLQLNILVLDLTEPQRWSLAAMNYLLQSPVMTGRILRLTASGGAPSAGAKT